ncbi:MAG: hypothetical protein P8Y52_11205 [Xanthomonadales bacterium]
MTTYFPERMCCPRCDHGFSYMAVGSFNTFGATFYTDGFIEGPMYDDQGRLFRCPQCRAIGWNDEFICEEPGDDEDELAAVFDGEVGPIPMREYPGLLAEAPWRGPDEEKYVRIAAFWAANMPRRAPDSQPAPFNDDEHRNLLALLDLLGDSSQDRLMRAEILREMGRFEECLEVLVGFDDTELETVARLIRELAMGRERGVKPIAAE